VSRSHPHVVVIGAGFGGVRVARGLRGAPVRLTLIDPNNFHTFQPLLYQVATSGLEPGDISFPVRSLLRRDRRARFVMGTVTSIDLSDRSLVVDDDEVVTYDFLVIAAGTVSSSFDIPGVDEWSLPLKTLHDAVTLRDELLTRFERCSRAVLSGDAVDPEALSVIVVGGGPTGVEMAGGLHELLDRVLRKDFPELDVAGAGITLVEAAPRVLTPFDETSSAHAALALRRRGIDVRLGVGVDHVTEESVVLADGTELRAGTIIWAAGVTAHPLVRALGLPLGRGGRVAVQANLALGSHPEVFVIGDLAGEVGGQPALAQVAQPAIQGGVHVAAEIRRALAGEVPRPFRYRDKGSMATIGRNHAIAEFPGGRRFHGRLGWLMWLGLHIVYLIGFRNRATTLVNWGWNYLTYDRSARTLLSRR
jgi:NADH:ubiquinone reductase (H+-translocating)